MKLVLIILWLTISTNSYTQEIITVQDTCFTQLEIKDISKALDSLYVICDINDELILQYKSLISQQSQLIKLDSIQIESYTEQTILLKQNIEFYVAKERIANKWYNNKIVWLGLGVGTTILITRLTK